MQNPAYITQTFYPESDGKPMAETDTHRQLLTNLVFSLDHKFRASPEVYVSGNLLIYYVKGSPKKTVAPDVFVVRGIPKGDRRVYFLWEEGVAPQFIIELSSLSTWREDVFKKFSTYQTLGVQEYFIFDPTSDYLKDSPLIGFRLEDGEYIGIEPDGDRLHSDVLNLDLVRDGETLRLFDPTNATFLLTPAEEAEAHQQELKARLQAEAEIEKLRAELARLKQPS